MNPPASPPTTAGPARLLPMLPETEATRLIEMFRICQGYVLPYTLRLWGIETPEARLRELGLLRIARVRESWGSQFCYQPAGALAQALQIDAPNPNP